MKGIGIQLVDHTDEGEVLDIKIKPLRNSSGKITQGIVVGNTLNQNQAILLIAQQGEIKNEPILGIGIKDLVLDTEMLAYRHKIRQQFKLDGLVVETLDLYPSKTPKIEAYYG